MSKASSNPLVSIIVPTYNRAPFVTEAIESVLAQTYGNYEIILVDDGSTDETKQILQPYASLIHYIYQNNKGVSSARNTGINAATGDWIAFLDSDDIWFPEKLSVQVQDICTADNIDLHICNAEFIDKHHKQNMFDLRGLGKRKWGCKIISEPFIHLLKHQYAYLPSTLVRKNSIFFDEELSNREDLYYLALISLKSRRLMLNDRIMVQCLRRSESDELSLTQRNKQNSKHTLLVSEYLYKNLNYAIQNGNYNKIYADSIKRNLSNAYFTYVIRNFDSSKNYHKYLKLGLKAHFTLKTFLKFLYIYFKTLVILKFNSNE